MGVGTHLSLKLTRAAFPIATCTARCRASCLFIWEVLRYVGVGDGNSSKTARKSHTQRAERPLHNRNQKPNRVGPTQPANEWERSAYTKASTRTLYYCTMPATGSSASLAISTLTRPLHTGNSAAKQVVEEHIAAHKKQPSDSTMQYMARRGNNERTKVSDPKTTANGSTANVSLQSPLDACRLRKSMVRLVSTTSPS